MTPDQAIDFIRRAIVKDDPRPGNQTRFARRVGVSTSTVSAVLNGEKAPHDKILDAVGLTRFVTYKKKGAQRV